MHTISPDLTLMPLTNFNGCPPPQRKTLTGRHVRLEPMDEARHASLTDTLCGEDNAALWDYIPFGPLTPEDFFSTFKFVEESQTWVTFTLVDQKSDAALGTASFMRLRPHEGSAEIGCVIFGHALQRTIAATEFIYLTACHLFDELGYRRYEWKCNNENEASKRAAIRFGFRYEGLFRNDMVVKGKNRDTAWFAMTDEDWKALKPGYEAWLADENFDDTGQQLRTLQSFTG